MKIGVMGGSYDPVHNGHVAVADHVRRYCGLDEVWMSMSPQSPFKQDRHPASDIQRFEMLKLACATIPRLKAIDTELSMPRPSYTIDLLERLARENPHDEFVLIIGGDNWQSFGKWYRSEDIISHFGVIVYPRPGYELPEATRNVEIVEALLHDISSSEVRKLLKRGGDVNKYLAPAVYNYIKLNKLYEQSGT